jgi:hypothetical protein
MPAIWPHSRLAHSHVRPKARMPSIVRAWASRSGMVPAVHAHQRRREVSAEPQQSVCPQHTETPRVLEFTASPPHRDCERRPNWRPSTASHGRCRDALPTVAGTASTAARVERECLIGRTSEGQAVSHRPHSGDLDPAYQEWAALSTRLTWDPSIADVNGLLQTAAGESCPPAKSCAICHTRARKSSHLAELGVMSAMVRRALVGFLRCTPPRLPNTSANCPALLAARSYAYVGRRPPWLTFVRTGMHTQMPQARTAVLRRCGGSSAAADAAVI